jgi:preprotein translocase subunit SecE
LAERLSPKQEVVGSIPAWPALKTTPSFKGGVLNLKKERIMADTVKRPSRLSNWWRETVGELHKVSWPTPREAWRLTRIVILVMLAVGIFLGLLDYGLSKLISLILA